MAFGILLLKFLNYWNNFFGLGFASISFKHSIILIFRASDQSPATVVSASSPEADLSDQVKRKAEGLPGLRLISMEEGMSTEERSKECRSPEIPVCCPVPIKGELV